MSAFEQAVAFTLAAEGTSSHDPNDPGGETHWGISRRSYPDLTPWPPTKEQAIKIYHRDYWQRLRCDALPPAVGLALFDTAVNLGRLRAAHFLQRAVEAYEDGILGPKTLAAVQERAPLDVVTELLARRLTHYADLPESFDRYALGWSRRVLHLLLRCAGLGDSHA